MLILVYIELIVMALFPRSILFSFLFKFRCFGVPTWDFDVLVSTLLLVFKSTGIRIGISCFPSAEFFRFVVRELVLTVLFLFF